MKNLPTFEEFLNESYLISESGIWFKMNNGEVVKLKDGNPATVYIDDVMTSSPTPSSRGKSLGIKVNWAMNSREGYPVDGDRYLVFRVLSGPHKETRILEIFSKSTRNTTYHSITPGKYKFKTEEIDAEAIPSDAKAIYDELAALV